MAPEQTSWNHERLFSPPDLALQHAAIFVTIRPLILREDTDNAEPPMNGSRLTIAWIAAALLGMAGCHSSPWTASRDATPAAQAANAAAGNATASSASANPATSNPTNNTSASTANTTVDAQAMQKVMAELQQAGTLDPASRDRLMQDLQQTDPSLWPLVIQQFRAGLAYRQQAEQRKAGTANSSPAETATAAAPSRSADDHAAIRTTATAKTEAAAGSAPQESRSSTSQPASSTASTPSPPVQPASATAKKADPAAEQTSKRPRDDGVVQASYAAVKREDDKDDYHNHLAAAIRACESELSTPAKTPEDEARHAQLRMMQLLAGRRDDAMKSIPGAKSAVQNFWSAEIYGLSLWMDADRTPDASRRAAEARQHLCDAVAKLGESCPLVVKNLAFCSKIQSYGCTKQFDLYEFSAGQNVLLYAEVENLGNEATPQGIHTSLRSSYQILDSRGQRVADEEFPVTEEYCRNARRDYFVGYEFRLPDRIYPGKHTLQLTVEDLKSKKVGQSSIEFTVKK
jgi:hypothetical protein